MLVDAKTTITFEKDGKCASYAFTLLPGRKHRHHNAAALASAYEVARTLHPDGYRMKIEGDKLPRGEHRAEFQGEYDPSCKYCNDRVVVRQT